MARSVLVVTKDRSEFENLEGPVRILKSHGISVVIVAEGLSMKLWTDAGYQIYNGFSETDRCSPNTLERSDIIPREVLKEFSPQVVVTGLGSPINLGEKFGMAVNEWNLNDQNSSIALGYVEDVWGVHRRSAAVPHFVCTLDEHGAWLIRSHGPYDYLHSMKPCIAVTGSPAHDLLRTTKADLGVKKMVSGCKRVVLIAGQGSPTTELIEGLLEALSRIGDYILIPRLHPKWLQVTDESILAESSSDQGQRFQAMLEEKNKWRDLLAGAKGGHVLWVDSRVETRSLMKSADQVVSIYSNALVEAVALGCITVSWASSRGREEMARELGGLTSFPLVPAGCVIEVKDPDEYIKKVLWFEDTERRKEFQKLQQETLRIDGKSAARVAAEIKKFL